MTHCYVCQKQVFDRSLYMVHLRDHSTSGKKIFPTKCIDNRCKYEYLDLEQFNRHLRDRHNTFPKKNIVKVPKHFALNNENKNVLMNDQEMCDLEINSEQIFEKPNIQDISSNIKNKIFKDFLFLKSKAQLSESMLNQILIRFSDTYNFIIEFILNYLQQIASSWKDNRHDEEIYEFIKVNENLKDSLNFMKSSYKQNKTIEDHHLYVKPERFIFGDRIDTHFKKNGYKMVQKNNTYEYISIIKTLNSLLDSERIRKIINESFNDPKAFQPFFFSNSNFWSKQSTIRIILYFDEIEIKNPLGDAAGTYKLGMFYFTIQNFTKKHNSNLNNIFLVAATFSDDLKRYGINTILDRIVQEIKILELDGIKIGDQIFNASILQFVGDNLSVHQIFNLKLNFIGSNICHLCNASVESIQKSYSEDQFQKTTQSSYNSKIQEILNDPTKSSQYGITNKCSLNDLSYFHLTNNYMFDLTHDLWEGIVPLELSLILEEFIFHKKYFKLELLNERIISFNYGLIDKDNKPSTIRLIKGKLKLRQKAAKIKCLFRNFSFLIGDRVPKHDKHWQLYLLLSRITNLAYYESITIGETIQLDWLVEEHHVIFKQLFENTNLRKKHHNMIHYGNSIRQIGSLSNYETIRFEAKHKFFKTAAGTINNCNNILHSIAKKHQIYFLHNKLNEELLNVEEELIKGSEVKIDLLDNEKLNECIRKIDKNVSTCLINCQIKMYNQIIKQEAFYLIEFNSNIKIARVKDIININNVNLLFVQIFDTLNFDEHYNACEVEETNNYELICFDNIYHYHPFDLIKNLLINDSRKFVRPYINFNY